MIVPSNDENPISEIITFLSDDDIPCDLAHANKCVYTTAAPKKNTQSLMSSKTKCTSENKVTVIRKVFWFCLILWLSSPFLETMLFRTLLFGLISNMAQKQMWSNKPQVINRDPERQNNTN